MSIKQTSEQKLSSCGADFLKSQRFCEETVKFEVFKSLDKILLTFFAKIAPIVMTTPTLAIFFC